MKNRTLQYFALALLVIFIDQSSKFWVHQNMLLGKEGEIPVIGFIKLHYVLNPGMAFGQQIDFKYGKLFLTLFRFSVVIFLGNYLYQKTKSVDFFGMGLGAFSLILGGAIGNLIDSIFYGVWFDNAPLDSVMTWFHGQVIDMIFCDIWEGYLPYWIPFMGGTHYSTPIFNVADSSIFIGVCLLIVFQSKIFVENE